MRACLARSFPTLICRGLTIFICVVGVYVCSTTQREGERKGVGGHKHKERNKVGEVKALGLCVFKHCVEVKRGRGRYVRNRWD